MVHTKPPYEDSIVAYVDILGWSDLLRQSNDPQILAQVMQVVARLDALAEASESRREQFNREGHRHAANTRFSYFSDTVVLSCPVELTESGWMVWEVQLLCEVLLRSGCYARGAIVRGLLQHTETILFGPALVEAHEIEQRVAKYPRVIVTPGAAPFVVAAANLSGPPLPLAAQWSLDTDGLRFLEIFRVTADGKRPQRFQAEVRKVRDLVARDFLKVSLLDQPTPADLNHQAKYGWMLRYLDGVLASETVPAAAESSIPPV